MTWLAGLKALSDTLLGLIRMGWFCSALTVLLFHVTSLNIEATDVFGSTLLVLRILQLAIESICTLSLCADATVKAPSLDGCRSQVSVAVKVLGPTLWLNRLYLTLVVSGSFSCEMYNRVTEAYMAYDKAFIVVLTTGLLLVISHFIRGIKEARWFCTEHQYDDDESDVHRGLPSDTRYVHIPFFAVPLFVSSINIAAFVRILVATPPSCYAWAMYFRICVSLVSSICLTIELIYKLKTSSNVSLPLSSKLVMVHISISAIAPDVTLTSQEEIQWTVVALAVVCSFLPFLPSLVKLVQNRQTFRNDISALKTNYIKWLRQIKDRNQLAQTLFLTSTIFHVCGLLLAVSTIYREWFSIRFTADKSLKNIFDIANKFERQLNQSLLELETIIYIVQESEFSEIAKCEYFITALTGAIALSYVPFVGNTLAVSGRQFLRLAKFLSRMAQKATSFGAYFKELRVALNDLTRTLGTNSKSFSIGLSISNYTLAVFLFPALLTGVLALYISFWPRSFIDRSSTYYRIVLGKLVGGAVILIVFNVYILFAFEVFGSMRESGWRQVEVSAACSIVGTLTFGLMLFLAKQKPQANLSNTETSPVTDSDIRTERKRKDLTLTSSKLFKRRTLRKRQMLVSTCTPPPSPKISKSSSPTSSQINLSETITSRELGGKPRQWILVLTISLCAVVFAVCSTLTPWISFKPSGNTKLAKHLTRLQTMAEGGLLLRDDFETDSKDCEIFTIPLKLFLRKFLSLSFLRIWKTLLHNLKQILPTDELEDYALFVSTLIKVATVLPTFFIFLLTVSGYLSSFKPKTRFCLPMETVHKYVGKVGTTSIMLSMNILVLLTNLYREINILHMTFSPHIRVGFIFGLSSQLLVILVWIGMSVEILGFKSGDEDLAHSTSRPLVKVHRGLNEHEDDGTQLKRSSAFGLTVKRSPFLRKQREDNKVRSHRQTLYGSLPNLSSPSNATDIKVSCPKRSPHRLSNPNSSLKAQSPYLPRVPSPLILSSRRKKLLSGESSRRLVGGHSPNSRSPSPFVAEKISQLRKKSMPNLLDPKITQQTMGKTAPISSKTFSDHLFGSLPNLTKRGPRTSSPSSSASSVASTHFVWPPVRSPPSPERTPVMTRKKRSLPNLLDVFQVDCR